ncbi:MAG: hypothetical protein PHQ40_01320 [Anaerolineaceae bacterium]|nr:hypothetical protein [Anaerolineaceae bacterium]
MRNLERTAFIQRLQPALTRPWVFPLVLLGIGLISYGIQVFHMGFYWDDWQAVFLSRVRDRSVLWDYFAYDRPFSAWTYVVTFPFLGIKPYLWQITTLIFRWGGVLCTYGVLAAIWPSRGWITRWVCAILMVYPGFTMQSISVAFNQHFLTYAIFSISLLSMVWAVRFRRFSGFWLGIALLTGLAHAFTMEYFVGLELLRPIILWLLLAKPDEKFTKTVLRVFLWWLPFILAIGIFTFWRVFYYPTHAATPVRNTPSVLINLMSAPGTAISNLVGSILADSVYLIFDSWQKVIQDTSQVLFARATIIAIILGAMCTFTFVFYLRWAKIQNPGGESNAHFYRQAVLISLVALVFGGLPVWLTARLITVGKWSSRFSLAPMLGAIVLVVLFVVSMIRTPKQRTGFLAVLLCLSIVTQVRTTDRYRRDWDNQRNYYWQLFWRAPGLKPGTAVFSREIPSNLLADYSAGYALNVIYGGDALTSQAQYWFMTPRDVGRAIPNLAPRNPVHYTIRNLQFEGNTSDMIVLVFHPSGGCLRVLDSPYTRDPILDQPTVDLIPFSNTNQILIQPGSGSSRAEIFGAEPAHTWCYYYQKADLARQVGDWKTVGDLMNQAQEKHLAPLDGSEWLPWMDALIQTGRWKQALEIGLQAQHTTAGLEPFLCTQWKRYSSLASSGDQSRIVIQANTAFTCDSAM